MSDAGREDHTRADDGSEVSQTPPHDEFSFDEAMAEQELAGQDAAVHDGTGHDPSAETPGVAPAPQAR